MPAATGSVDARAQPPKAARRNLRLAWVSLALLPVSFVLAMVLGEGLAALQGYNGGSDEEMPITVALRTGLPALLVLIAPGVAATYFGLRARGQGQPAGLAPAIVGAVWVLISIALNLLGLVVGLVLERFS